MAGQGTPTRPESETGMKTGKQLILSTYTHINTNILANHPQFRLKGYLKKKDQATLLLEKT